jgi:hypothetical protein
MNFTLRIKETDITSDPSEFLEIISIYEDISL